MCNLQIVYVRAFKRWLAYFPLFYIFCIIILIIFISFVYIMLLFTYFYMISMLTTCLFEPKIYMVLGIMEYLHSLSSEQKVSHVQLGGGIIHFVILSSTTMRKVSNKFYMVHQKYVLYVQSQIIMIYVKLLFGSILFNCWLLIVYNRWYLYQNALETYLCLH